MSDVKTCSTCHNEKSLNEFYCRTKNGTLKYEPSCKPCMQPKIKERTARAKAKREADPVLLQQYKTRMRALRGSEKYKAQTRAHQRSEKGKATKKAYHARLEVKARSAEQAKTNLNTLISGCRRRDFLKKRVSDIDDEWLKTTLDEQDHKCHYCQTMLSLCFRDMALDQISIDRQNNSVGYVKTNCLLTCLFCNYCRNQTDYHLYLELIESLRSGTLATIFSNYQGIPIVPSNLRNSIAGNDRKKGLNNTLSTDDVKQLLESQNYKCAITGLPLINSTVPYFPLKPSVDRIDNMGDHNVKNCQIIIMAVNLGKNNRDNDAVKAYLEAMRIKQEESNCADDLAESLDANLNLLL